MSEVDALAGRLSISGEGLKRLRRQYRMDHGEEAEAKLLAWLKATWEQQRDRVQRMAKGSGYTEHWSKSMGASRRSQLGNLHHEPESVGDTYQTMFDVDARARRAAERERSLKAQQAQLRSFTEAMKARLRKGEDITPYLAQVQRDTR